jgi:hypothetical protein
MPLGDFGLQGSAYSSRDRIAAEIGVDAWRGALTEIGGVEISTVFFGRDYNFLRRGPPIVFETMIFGGRLDHSQSRCATWGEAGAIHTEAVGWSARAARR